MRESDGTPIRRLRPADYLIDDGRRIMTPALAIYPEIVQSNIDATLRQLGGVPNRWRVHVKTAKLQSVMTRLVESGIKQFKCATSLELLVGCRAGANDCLLAHPLTGANAARVREIAEEFPGVHISVLVESLEHIAPWRGGPVSLFLDINPGMDRTGISQTDIASILTVVRAIQQDQLEFRGLHYYDGHLHAGTLAERTLEAHRGYRCLQGIVSSLEGSGIGVEEVITSGTPTFPAALCFDGFDSASFLHRVSPGTVVYSDTTSLGQLPSEYGYRPAAVVVSRVVSHPRPGIFTCDAGHKTLSVDSGVPNCAILGHPEFQPAKPSEEHLPIQVQEGADRPPVGDLVYLVPRHVCPTVNNFDHAVLVRRGHMDSVERITARGREQPLPEASLHP